MFFSIAGMKNYKKFFPAFLAIMPKSKEGKQQTAENLFLPISSCLLPLASKNLASERINSYVNKNRPCRGNDRRGREKSAERHKAQA